MRFWQSLAFTETDQLVELARSCEALGFHGALVSDHVFVPEKLESRYPYSEDGRPGFDGSTEFPEPWAAIAAMATATSRLRFCTAIYIAPLRDPLEVAKSVSTASVLSQGRAALGVGVGWVREEYDQLGAEFATRGRRLDEMLEVLTKLWAGGMLEHHGRHYDFDRLQISPSPPGPIPIYVGGASDAALRRAARHDGWIGSGHEPTEIPDLVSRMRALRSQAGRASEPFEIIAAVNAPPEPDLVRRLEEEGVTGLIAYPPVFTVGPGASLERKRAALERFAESVIAKR